MHYCVPEVADSTAAGSDTLLFDCVVFGGAVYGALSGCDVPVVSLSTVTDILEVRGTGELESSAVNEAEAEITTPGKLVDAVAAIKVNVSSVRIINYCG